ncbi:hypothetical protein [Campylobacter majalis]|uniref:DUF7834 domain-containing protein n=1 Tax=Campylobacter majalis TaxID=2790656 RepID=UPI003D6911F3
MQKYDELLKDESFTCYETLGGAGNIYLAKIYQALILFYRDKFNDDSYEVEKYLQILLLNLRLGNDSVTRQNVAWNMQGWFKEIAFTSNKNVFKNKLKQHIKNNIFELNLNDLTGQKLYFYDATYFKNEIEKEFKK